MRSATAALDVRFAANVDPADLERALEGADPASTLFVVASKTFTTQETMANAERARRWGAKALLAVTANTEAARQFGASEILPMWDWVGGRFSVWSAVGFAAAVRHRAGWRSSSSSTGASDIDRALRRSAAREERPGADGADRGVEPNFLGAATHAVLPYSNALRLLPAYLQQLEMESNGKRVDREGRALDYATAPVLWGARGHGEPALLPPAAAPGHAGRAGGLHRPAAWSKNLSANCRAQADALAFGTDDPALPPYRQYPGNRPSSMLSLEELNARNLGGCSRSTSTRCSPRA